MLHVSESNVSSRGQGQIIQSLTLVPDPRIARGKVIVKIITNTFNIL